MKSNFPSFPPLTRGGLGGVFEIKVPSWRATGDIEIAEDIVEEIVRIYGYNNIEPVFPIVKMKRVEISPEKKLIEKSRDIFSKNLAMTEVYNYSFNGTEQLEGLGIDCKDYIKLANPASEKQDLMRQSLVPNLLGNIEQNIRNFDEFSLFEIGSVYLNKKGESAGRREGKEFLPKQDKMISGFLLKKQSASETIFYQTKEAIKLYLKEIGFNDIQFGSSTSKKEVELPNNTLFHPARFVLVEVNGKAIGILCEIHPLVLSKLDIKNRVGCFELNLSMMTKLNVDKKRYKELSKFPAVERDFAFVLDKKILYNKFVQEIRKISDLVSRVQLFDIYEDEKVLGKNKKSLAFHIDFQSAKRTLTAEEVDQVQEKIIKRLEKKFAAKIR